MFLGVDVGGTNSDAVVISERNEVVCWAKETTTDDVTSGVVQVVGKVLDMLPTELRDKGKIERVCIGTTHFLNAVIQRQRLAKVSVVRLCGTASVAMPPFIDVRQDLRNEIQGNS